MIINSKGITINFGGTRSDVDDSRTVVARIYGFPDDSPKEPIDREMVVPAGESVAQELPFGLYHVALTLPSGRIIQRSVTIDADADESIRFFEDFAPRGGFSLQEGSGRDGQALLAQSAAASGNTSGPDYDRAMTVAADAHRRAMAARPIGKSATRSRRSAIEPDLPLPPAHPLLSLEQGLDPGTAAEPPAVAPGGAVEPVELHGNSALWRIAHGDPQPPTRATRRWARIALPDGRVELASLPLPWFCSAINEFSPAEVLVDPARRAGAASTVAVRDARLAGLLSYLDRGQAGAAKAMLEALENDNVIEQTIYDKMANPLAACAAAYVGLAVYDPGEREQWDHWLENCMARFPGIPDAAIVHARRLVLRPTGEADNARAAASLRAACAAGVPFFSTGVLLLREMLLQLSGDHPDLETLADKAGRIAGRVDPGQAFTVLRYAAPRAARGAKA